MTLSKGQLKLLTNLRLKKFRSLENKFIVEGERAVSEGLKSNYKCNLILVTQEFYDKNINYLNKFGNLEIVKNNDLKKITDTVNPQGIAAVFNKINQEKEWTRRLNSKIIVCLENVSDPGNVGTIIRNCDWFGINNLILSNNCADIYNPKTIRSTVGSLFHTNIYFSNNIIEDLKKLKEKDYKILSAALNGTNIFSINTFQKFIIILGNEANGISKELLELSDKKITIPKLGKAESLNVANASAVILAELTK